MEGGYSPMTAEFYPRGRVTCEQPLTSEIFATAPRKAEILFENPVFQT
jgi:hypothetical protein